MFIGDILIARGLVAPVDVDAALRSQSVTRGTVGDCLVALGKLDSQDLEAVIHSAPTRANTVAATGLSLSDLLDLLVKSLHNGLASTPSGLSDTLKLSPRVIDELLAEAADRQLLLGLGPVSRRVGAELRYALTRKGTEWAAGAVSRNEYIGPAPVPLTAYCAQILTQLIAAELIDEDVLHRGFADLEVSKEFILRIGPAINSGRSILLYGPAGNGKSSVAARIGKLFRDVIYVPYVFEVDGQFVKVFDPAIHKEIKRHNEPRPPATIMGREDFDQRWVACERPVCVTGGELTLEMLDLQYRPDAKYYEAPLHIKALGGIFIIDDFGRQLLEPAALLNRWIVPMGSKIEHLKFQSGKSFSLPFDEIIIFCTNLSPNDIMDPAFLRRIHYKIEMPGPTPDQFRDIFRRSARDHGVEVSDAVIDYVIRQLREHNDFPLANFQPGFIIEQVLTLCRFKRIAPEFQTRFIDIALNNLYTKDLPGHGGDAKAKVAIRSVS
jgi:hypothetical protein